MWELAGPWPVDKKIETTGARKERDAYISINQFSDIDAISGHMSVCCSPKLDELVKSLKTDCTVKSSRCKARES
jgi:hypothetical protein